MTYFRTALLFSAAVILAACEPASNNGSALDAGHDHAAIQAGQSSQTSPQNTQMETASYTCPMHPHYISDDPNGTCPICGMDLVPVKGAPSQDLSLIHI